MEEEAEVFINIIRGVDGGAPGLNLYDVEVVGKEPLDYVKSYTLSAKNDTLARQEALRRFAIDVRRLEAENRG
jgi:hypothetical protein